MIHALTAAQVRLAEERAVAEGAATLAELMERAGRAVAGEVAARVPEGPVAVLAGGGNNGGDGWIAARELHAAGREVHVYSAVKPSALEGIAAGHESDGARRQRARDPDPRLGGRALHKR